MGSPINIKTLLFEDLQLQIQNLKNKYVGTDKPISEEDFVNIQDVSNKKFNNIAWLTKKVGTDIIKAEDIYKYKEYFEIFEKNKNKFEQKDLNLYKTKEDVQKFLDKIISIREKDVEFEDIKGQENYVSQSDIEKLTSTGGIDYLGMWNGYQVFKVSKVSEEVWKPYRDILGRCKGRNRGAKIDICTIGNYNYFKRYLKDYKLSNYFLLFNLNDPLSPYQLHHESRQFMDKNDRNVEERKGFNYVDFYDFIGKKFPKYSLETLKKFTDDSSDALLLPVAGKGLIDEKGKQGEWETFWDGELSSVHTYKDDKLDGPFVIYRSDGEIKSQGTMRKNNVVGDYVKYNSLGTITEKGKYNLGGNPIGIWRFNLGEASTTNYVLKDMKTFVITGYTENDTLRYLGLSKKPYTIPYKYGPFTFYHSNSKIAAKGKLIGDRQSGEWKYFDKDENLIAKGRWAYGEKNGPWTETIIKKGRKYLIKLTYSQGKPLSSPKPEIFDARGDFLYSAKPKNIEQTLGLDLDKVARHEYIDTQD